MMALDHDQAQELLGAFALDALDPEEADAVDVHLRECPRCRAEVGEYREAASLLAFGGVEAPDGLWDRIVENLEEAPPRLELARVVPMAPPASRWRSVGVRLVLAAAVVMSLLALGLSLPSRNSGRSDVAADIGKWTLDPATRKVHLVSPDGVASADVLIRDGQGWLAKDSLPKLPDDETYQLWGQKGETKVSLGVLGGDPSSVRFPADTDYDALAITAEHKPGVVSSSQPAVVAGWVPTA
jgi:anti-sigma factor RsiW